ncbi:MAG: DUF1304 domain-containing protein [Proteobacteria bacterium]|nr:MAG: DUF1304 domain-containing protein [Pseudomonadota bacterium]
MNLVSHVLVALVAVLHLTFLALEMFLWQKPLGLKTFRLTPEFAKATANLAANQGLYNGFLAAGLIISFTFQNLGTQLSFRLFFLSCVIVAGVFGALTVSKRIFVIQAVPAILAITAVWLTRFI